MLRPDPKGELPHFSLSCDENPMTLRTPPPTSKNSIYATGYDKTLPASAIYSPNISITPTSLKLLQFATETASSVSLPVRECFGEVGVMEFGFIDLPAHRHRPDRFDTGKHRPTCTWTTQRSSICRQQQQPSRCPPARMLRKGAFNVSENRHDSEWQALTARSCQQQRFCRKVNYT